MSRVRHRCVRCARRRKPRFLTRIDGNAWLCSTNRARCYLTARETTA